MKIINFLFIFTVLPLALVGNSSLQEEQRNQQSHFLMKTYTRVAPYLPGIVLTKGGLVSVMASIYALKELQTSRAMKYILICTGGSGAYALINGVCKLRDLKKD